MRIEYLNALFAAPSGNPAIDRKLDRAVSWKPARSLGRWQSANIERNSPPPTHSNATSCTTGCQRRHARPAGGPDLGQILPVSAALAVRLSTSVRRFSNDEQGVALGLPAHRLHHPSRWPYKPVEAPTNAVPSDPPEHYCQEHQTPFKQYKRGDNVWWSHKTADGNWCLEK